MSRVGIFMFSPGLYTIEEKPICSLQNIPYGHPILFYFQGFFSWKYSDFSWTLVPGIQRFWCHVINLVNMKIDFDQLFSLTVQEENRFLENVMRYW